VQDFDKQKNPLKSYSIGGLAFTASEEPHIVLGKQVDNGIVVNGLRHIINDDVKNHKKLCHTTSIYNFKLIINNMTLRCNNLASADLNDAMEKQRVSISQYATGRFISCFSHIDHESVPFWVLYGNDIKSKLFLVFNNFSTILSDVIHFDYCLLDGGTKAFFKSDEYFRTGNTNSQMVGQAFGLTKINEDFDTRNCVESIEMLDIEYLPVDHTAFTDDYSGETRLFTDNSPDASYIKIKKYQPECLGKQKTNPWDYEQETRILCCLHRQDFKEWQCLYLRLKEEIFRNLIIITSPWAEESLKNEVESIIQRSTLSYDIKSSIEIRNSSLKGTLNFDYLFDRR